MKTLAFGPELPGFGSWDWIGSDLSDALSGEFKIRMFRERVPECDLAVVVKHKPPGDDLESLAKELPVLFLPVDRYGSAAEIDKDAPFLSRCAGVVLHAKSLRKYFQSYAPVFELDHHLKYVADAKESPSQEGPILWTGVRTNVAPLADWCCKHKLPGRLLVLTNPEDPRHVPTPDAHGFPGDCDVEIDVWTPERHIAALGQARAAIDIKGDEFRARHKPPTKAFDAVASGLPLALNPGHPAIPRLNELGLNACDPRDSVRWFSSEYRTATEATGRRLQRDLSRDKVANRLSQIISRVLSKRSQA